VRQDVQLSDRVRLELGLRGDLFRFGVDDHLAGRPAAVPHVSGVRWHGLVSPKANLALQVAPQTALFGNVGYGFHSNDARDVVAAARDSMTGGLTVRDVGQVSGGLRYRHIASRAADKADSIIARGYTIVELFGTRQFSRVQLVVTVDNLLNVVWNEAQFATTSRLQNERAPVTDLNFTPGTPRTIQVGLDYRF
jgi:hypothetical protein